MKRWTKVGLCLLAGSLVILIGVCTSTGINKPPCTPPSISSQPSSQTKCQGQTASFSVIASGAQSYQWRKSGAILVNGGTISGVTSNTLTISAVTTNAAGSYDVVITNTCDSVTSSSAMLTVMTTGPSILSQPTNQTVCAGQTASFSVTASGAPSYQWLKNGSVVSGATNATVTISSVTASNTGPYNVVVSNACGIVVSSNAMLTVNVIPSAPTASNNGPISAGNTLKLSVSAVTSATYSWTGPNGFTSTAQNSSITNATTAASGIYTVIVTVAGCGSAMGTTTGTVAYTPSLGSSLPVITTQPQSKMAMAGSNVTFSVTATGTAPLSYQWRKNSSKLTDGGSVSGAHTNMLTLTNVGPWDAGIYTVTISNASGNVVSSCAALRVFSSSSIVAWGDDNLRETDLPDGLTNVMAIAAGGFYSLALNGDGTLVGWGGFDNVDIPDGLTNVVAITAGWWHDLVLKADGTVAVWGDNTYGQTNVPSGLTNVVAISAGAYHNLALKADGTVVAWGYNLYGQTNVPSNLTNVVGVAGGSTHSLALKGDGTVVAWGNNSYGQTNVPSSLTNVVAIAGGYKHSLALKADGTVVAWGNCTFGETNVPSNLTNVVAIAAGVYHSLAIKSDGTVVAWGWNYLGQTNVPLGLANAVAIAGGSTHSLALVNLQPVITSQPTNQTVCAGQTASFTATASGTPTPTIQWQVSTDGGITFANISGATITTLTFTAGASDNGNQYRAIFSNNSGSVISSVATLTVTNAPVTIHLTSGTLNYMLGRPPTPLDGAISITVTGSVSTNYFNGKKLMVAFTTSQSNDYLSVRNSGSGSNQIRIAAQLNGDGSRNITNGTAHIGTCKGGTAQVPLAVTFNSNARTNHVEAVLRNVSFYNTSPSPSKATREVSMVFSNESGVSISQTETVTINADCPSAIDAVLVLDKTGSMSATDVVDAANQTRLQVSEAAATNFLGCLKLPTSGDYLDRVSVIAFPREDGTSSNTNEAGSVTNMTYNPTFGTNYQSIANAILHIPAPQGATMYAPSLQAAHVNFTNLYSSATYNSNRLQVVIFLTDGGLLASPIDNCANTQPCYYGFRTNAVNAARLLTEKGARVLTIGFAAPGTFTGEGTNLLQEMASSWPVSDDCLIAPSNATLQAKYAGIASGVCRGEMSVSITPTNPIYCAGSSMTFTTAVSGVGPFGYVWKQDNNILAGQTNSILVLSSLSLVNAGTYSIVVTGAYGSVSNSTILTVNPLPTVSVTPGSATICSGGSATISASGAATYSWSPATGLDTTIGATVHASPTATTTYTVTGTSANGCHNTASVTVAVNSSPIVSVAPGSATICNGGSATLTASGAATYSWSPPTGLDATNAATVHASPASTTTYTVTGTSANGCQNTASVTVTVNTLPTVSVTPGSATICSGGSATISASGAATYSWSPATGLDTTIGATVHASPTATTTYTVTGTSANGCQNTASVTVTVNPPPTCLITGASLVYTLSISNSYSATAGMASYNWTINGNGTISGASSAQTVTVNAGVSNTFTLAVSITDSNACSNSCATVVSINQPPNVNISSPTNNQVFFAPALVTLTATASDSDGTISQVEFFHGTNNLGTGTVINASYSLSLSNVASGLYEFSARATDNLGAIGASAPVSIIVGRASSRTFTLDADFDGGSLINLNHTAPTNDQLQLNQRITPFPFVNIGCSSRGTIAKIDVNTGEIIGEYWSAPANMNRSPSRMTADKFGNIWVGNRLEGNNNTGSVTRIGLVIGGTRVRKNPDGSLTADTRGEYLKPPFYYNTCVDKDGDGLIRTSRGRGDILPWNDADSIDKLGAHTNASGYFSGAASAEDEAITTYVRAGGSNTRTVAVDTNNDIWVGGYAAPHLFEKISGVDGLTIPGTQVYVGCGGYGGLVDANGILWSALHTGDILRMDTRPPFPSTCLTNILRDTSNYGLGIDPFTGQIWSTHYDNNEIVRIATNGLSYDIFHVTNDGLNGPKGIVVDHAGNVWVANNGGNGGTTVTHYLTNGTFVGVVGLPCALGPTGIAVDSNGKVWVANINSDNTMRIDPNLGPVVNGCHVGKLDMTVYLGSGAGPYNYSDMTGSLVLGLTDHSGMWTVIHDGELEATEWSNISWNNSTPTGTSMRVEARAADSIVGLTVEPFAAVDKGASLSNLVGRYIEMRTTLTTELGNTNSPVLYDLTVTWTNLLLTAVTNHPLVRADNHPPVATNDTVSVQRNSIGNELDVLANDTDPDGDPLTITEITPPAYGIVEISPVITNGQRIIYTPDPHFFGNDQMTYTVIDGYGGLARATVKISVERTSLTNATTAVPDSFTVDEGSANNRLDVLANDIEPHDGPLVITSNTPPIYGTVSIQRSCSDPDYFYYNLTNRDFYGTDGFDYTIANTNGATSTAHVTIYVRDLHDSDPPIAVADNFFVAKNSTNNMLNVTQNDYDPEGDPFSIIAIGEDGYASILGTPYLGAASIVAGGQQISYTPRPNFGGADYLYYRLAATNGLVSDWTPVSITVTNVGAPQPPIAVTDILLVSQDNTSYCDNLLANDIDPQTGFYRDNLGGNYQCTNLFLVGLTQPAHGTVANDSDCDFVGGIDYTPSSGFCGSDTFTYTVRNGAGLTATGSVIVLVYNSLEYPYLNFSVRQNSTNNILPIVLDNSTGFVAYSRLLHGTLIRSGANLLYTPPANFVGHEESADSLTYEEWTRATSVYVVATNSPCGVTVTCFDINVRSSIPPIARDDVASATRNSPVTINVLVNDTSPYYEPLQILSVAQVTNGATVTIAAGATNLTYQSATDFVGLDAFTYTIRASGDPVGVTATATVRVYVTATGNTPPSVTSDSFTVALNSVNNRLDVLNNDYDPYGDAMCIVEYTQPSRGTLTVYPTYVLYTPQPGNYDFQDAFTYRVTDAHHGLSGVATVTISVSSAPSQPPAAIITSPVVTYDPNSGQVIYPRVIDGTLNVTGTATNCGAGSLSYDLIVYTPEGNQVIRTNQQRQVTNGLLGTLDLSQLPNGIYDIQLLARSGSKMASAQSRFVLDSQLKIGQFSFSQQDVVIPVSGVPLSVIRTYNSLSASSSPLSSDFGPGWSYAINDMQVQFDEDRELNDSLDDTGMFSMRVGGGRDVILTLPDGRRTTFEYSLQPAHLGFKSYYQAVWTPPPGVHASLRTIDPDDSAVDVYGFPHWRKNPEIPMDSYDFSGFILTTADGTQYRIDRQDLGPHIPDFGEDQTISGIGVNAYGPAYLSQIKDRGGNYIQIGSGQIDYYNPSNVLTKSVLFQRDPQHQNRIIAIYDPNSSAGAPPVPCVVYSYDTAGNLSKVYKLVSATGGTGVPACDLCPSAAKYETTQYIYGNPNFPHYITSIKDPRGLTPLRNLYDDQGRLYGVIDAFGKTNTFVHDLANKTETVFDRLGNPTVHGYDTRGNITQEIQYLNGRQLITSRTFDANNNETSVTDPLGHTTSYTYDGNGNRTSVTDALSNTVSSSYNGTGQLLTKVDPLNHITSFEYDSGGHRTKVVDALGHSTTFGHDIYGRPTAVTNALNQLRAVAGSDSIGNLQYVGEVGGVRMDFGHDANNNTTNTSFMWVNPDDPNQTRTLPTATEFDAANRITRVTDPDGLARTTIYDEGGRVAQNIDRMGLTNSFLYDAMGNTVQTTYPDGAITRVVYDAMYRVLFTVDRHLPGFAANGNHTVYDSLGRVTRTERISNVQIDIVYDGAVPGSVLISTGAVLSASSTVYDDAGRVLATTNALGYAMQYEYDAVGRQTAVIDALTNRTVNVYDAAGRLQCSTNALNKVTRYEYDAKGRQIKTIFPDPAGGGAGTTFTSNTYNEIGQLLAVTDQAGLRTDFECDNLGRVKAVIKPPVYDPEGGTNASPRYEYEYDQFGNIRVVRDPKRHETKSTYDAFGQLLSRALPTCPECPVGVGQTETNVYNSLGQLWKKYDFKGQETELVYDSLGRVVTNFLYATGSSTPNQTNIWEYAPGGQYLRITRPEGITTLRYNIDGAVTNILSPEGWIGYEYDPAMGYMTRAYTVNSDIRYGYDPLGRLKTVTVLKRNGQTINETTTYTYTALGSRESVALPNGGTTTYAYDSLNRLTNLTQRATGNLLLARYDYQLDATGHRTNAVEIILQPDDTSYITNNIGWMYDGMSRLVKEVRSQNSGASSEDDYSYDLVGNRKSLSRTGVPPVNYVYNNNDQLTSETTGTSTTTYLYDSNGSLTNRSSSVQSVDYSYNLEGRLSGVTSGGTTTSYVYNEQGIRVRSTTGGTAKYFLIDPNNHTGYAQVLEETTGSTLTMSYVIGGDVLAQASGNSASYLLYDGHGSTRQLLSGASHVSEQYNYDGYGQTIGTQFTSQNPPLTSLLYAGEQWDVNAQQYYLRARYYDPSNGRIGAMDQMDGTARDPQSLHKYAYCQNNPVNMRDPSGNQESLVELSFVTTIATIIEQAIDVHMIWTAGKMLTEYAAASESLDQIERQPASPDVDTATIIVHGLNGLYNGQPNGWSKLNGFQGNLGPEPKLPVGGASLNHDFYEFDWGGMSFLDIGLIPVQIVHTMALVHLQKAEELVSMKGYANIDIISHSWGTLLSYDLQNSSGIETHDWVTMGSPLKKTTEKPIWNTGKWINCYSLNDPVTHFEIFPPYMSGPAMLLNVIQGWSRVGIPGDGLTATDSNVTAGRNHNHPMDLADIAEHGAYWTRTEVLTDLRNDLQ